MKDKSVVQVVVLTPTEVEILKDNILHYTTQDEYPSIYHGPVIIERTYLHDTGEYGAFVIMDRKDHKRKLNAGRGHYVRCSPFTMEITSIIDEAIHDRVLCESEGYYQIFNMG